jgi:HTH-type transcriptional regulator/antitoxin HigA
MISKTNNRNTSLNPHPGIVLEKALLSEGMLQIELAKRTGLTAKTINSIIKGTAPISPETAMNLETVLGEPASYWLELEATYQINKINNLKNESLKKELPFLSKIHVKEMISKKWIDSKSDDIEQLRELYKFFGVNSVNQLSPVWSQLEVNYRTSNKYTQNHFNIMAWLRKGEILAKDINCKPYNSSEFRSALSECRKLTNYSFDKVYKKIQDICSEAGVAVVYVEELKNVSTSGAAHWIDKETALIQLSLRGKADDKFWFNFYHEAGHILLHGRKEQFIDNHGAGLMFSGKNEDCSDDTPYFTEENKLKEAEADEFSGNFLIPRKEFSKFVNEGDFSETSIKAFAKIQGISTGIVVGQLQNKGYLGWDKFYYLKRKYTFPANFF